MNIGDIVHLVSGSPRMTVVGVTPSGIITTSWVAYNTGVPHTLSAYASCFKLEGEAAARSMIKPRYYNHDEVPF